MKQHEQALLLLKKAESDEALLDEVLASSRVNDEVIGFHCQQAAEKLLKAALSELSIQFPRTHNLRVLMDLLGDARHSPPAQLANLDTLTPYGTLYRYEDMPSEVSLDRAQARAMVRDLRVWVKRLLGAGR